MRSDSFARSGDALARISTQRAANGCQTGIKLPAGVRLTMMIENSPRASKVKEVLSEPTVESFSRLPRNHTGFDQAREVRFQAEIKQQKQHADALFSRFASIGILS